MVDRLIAGTMSFQKNVLPDHVGLFTELADGQAPETLFITCADSRIDPWMITQSKPGDLFVIRNAGNIAPVVPADGSSNDGTVASIDYAVAVLGVSDIVVCGHSSCGAMKGLADLASLDGLPSVANWLRHSHALLPAGTDDLDDLIERNVMLQLDHLADYPTVRAALAADAITLHGWVYDIGSGVVRVHDGQAFVPVGAG